MNPKRVGIQLPCYFRELRPEGAQESFLFLKKVAEGRGFQIEIPKNQTCCGQPFINIGQPTTLPTQLDQLFSKYQFVVSFGSSCSSTIRNSNLPISQKNYEFVEFLVKIVGIKGLFSSPPAPVALHLSCHSIRHLQIGPASEIGERRANLVEELLGFTPLLPERDECCGFGGVYSVVEGELSYQIGRRKLEDLLQENPKFVIGVDLSCLLHLEGIYRRERERGQFPGEKVQFLYIGEFLAKFTGEEGRDG
ncbi:MAG: (Fe-S)-binding protein [Campylobacterales bacterium]